jgi:hypothetical protein
MNVRQFERRLIMEETKKVRAMTPRGFMHKSNGKAAVSATAFIAKYREYLLNGEVASVTSPIIALVDEGRLLPTPAMEVIRAAVGGYIAAADMRDANESIARRANEVDTVPGEEKEPGVKRIPKPWTATVYNGRGQVMVHVNQETKEESDLTKGFDLSQRATEWLDRRLFEGASDWFGVIKSNTLFNAETGDAISTIIIREDSIARIMKQPKGAVCKHKPKSGSRLSFGVKVCNDRAVFSRG